MFFHEIYSAKMHIAASEYTPPPYEKVPTPEKSTLGDVLRAAGTDLKESDDKLRTASSAALVAGMGAVGFSRLPFVVMSHTTLEVLEHTQSAPATGTAAAIMFGGWTLAAAKTYDVGMKDYPTVVATIKEKFPVSSNTLSDSLPGSDSPNKEVDASKKISMIRRLGRRASAHIRRGGTVEGVGISPYILSAHLQNKPRKEINKLAVTSSVDGGFVAGAIAGVVAGAIIKIGDKNPELAHSIQDTANNPKVLLAAAAALMVGEYTANMRKR